MIKWNTAYTYMMKKKKKHIYKANSSGEKNDHN